MEAKTKRESLIVVLLLAVAAFLTVGSTLAYLTDKGTETLSYTVGAVKISVKEPAWGQTHGSKDVAEHFDAKGNALLFPSRRIAKDPTITVADGSENCYVRLKVSIDPNLAQVLVWPPKENEGWKRTSVPGDDYTYYYTYKTALSANNKTNPAFSYVEVLGNIDLPPGKTHEDLLDAANDTRIDVFAEAIQTAAFGSVDEAFKAFDHFAVNNLP